MTLPQTAYAQRFRHVVIGVAICWICTLALRADASVGYSPPDDSADAATELKGIEREIADGNVVSAAKRLDALLAARISGLANMGNGTFASVNAWVDQLPAAQRQPLRTAYAAVSAKPAGQALDALRAGRTPAPEELYAVARRFPMTPAAGAALAEAGDRALQLGDLPAAQAYFELAAREGFALGDARNRRLDSIRSINAGVALPAPPDLDEITRAPRPGDRLAFGGLLPFDAAWYGSPASHGVAKFFPAAYDDRIILASWNAVSIFRENGQLLWRAPNPHGPASFTTDRPIAPGHGAVFAPAVLCDAYGRPVTVVVRQPTGGADAQSVLRAYDPSDGRYALRAFDAAEGKLLWTTESTDQRKDLSYCGLPAVGGRYVYSLAVSRTGPSAVAMVLCAADVMTGESIWQTTIGTLNEQSEQRMGGKFGRNAPLAMETLAEWSEPAVAGDLVIVAPNCGATIAVGRFDGRVRWIGTYRGADAAGAGEPRARGGREGERALVIRYRSTPAVCGNVVVIAPQDATAMIAFDRAGGRRLWETDANTADAYALVGASGDIAVTCGAELRGIDAGGTGKLKWRFTPARGVSLTGPAVVVGQTVIAPTTAGPVQVNVADGSVRPRHTPPDFRHFLDTDGGRAAASDAGATRAFVNPPAAR